MPFQMTILVRIGQPLASDQAIELHTSSHQAEVRKILGMFLIGKVIPLSWTNCLTSLVFTQSWTGWGLRPHPMTQDRLLD